MADHESGNSIVVIGASAGGIEALSQIVANLPPDLPAPVVIAQHLDPLRQSHLYDILMRRSTLPIRSIVDQEVLESGTVYIVRPNHFVEISDGTVIVRLDDASGPLPSIDLLFTTASASFGENTIAVILTGTGDDGSAGARDVKAAGGTVIIQNPETADFPGMPRSLPATIVDIVANLETIGPLLGDLLSGAYEPRTPDEERDLRRLLDQLHERSGIDFSSYKSPTIRRRLQRRMVATGATTMVDYVRFLQRNPEEYSRLVNSFLIKVTQFFRDAEVFDYLRDYILPNVIDHAREQGELRIWSAGCATGEEAYSLAILIAEYLGEDLDGLVVRIFATDLDSDAVTFARRGIYPTSAVASLPPEMVERYFTRIDGTYEVRKPIRSMVVLGQHDLAQRAPFPRIDVVFCRNVLIYFTHELQRRALQLFAFSLRDNGYLVLGKAETVSPLPEYFSLDETRLKTYRRVGDRVLMPTSRIRDTMVGMSTRVTPPRSIPYERRSTRAFRDQQALPVPDRAASILRSAPVGIIVVNEQYDIQMINPAARRLCGIHAEAVGEDLLHRIQHIPLMPLRSAVDAAFRGESVTMPVHVEPTETATGDSLDLQVHVHPETVADSEGSIDSVTLTILDVSGIMSEQRRVDQDATRLRDDLARVSSQAERLAEANRALVHANEELTSSNAELRSVNDELLVANEEVQSATEEVETLNEELQATNEELETLNEELQATVEELNTTNDDLQARSLELQDLAISLEDQQRKSELERDRMQAILENLGSAVLVVDGRGESVLSNDAFRSMFGVLGETFQPEDSTGTLLTQDLRLQQRVASGEMFSTEFMLTDEEQNRRWYEAVAQPIDDANGDRLGIIVVRDVTDRSLRALQDEFLALASHELRTPLTSLAGSLQLLQRKIDDRIDDQARHQLEIARSQTRQLTTLIRDLVDVVRLQTGRLELQRSPVDLTAVVRDACDAAQVIAQGQTIVVDVPDTPVDANVDSTRLNQVLMNLLSNAVTYAPGTETIEVSLRHTGRTADIRVRDFGPGIPEADRERIFARFSQLDANGSPQFHNDGLGLGLYIAREIVVAHGGSLTIDNNPEPGATFVVRLPLNTDVPS